MTDHIKTIQKHKAEFNFSKGVNPCLRLADVFLENNPEILYWTERNDSKRGIFYLYENGIYKKKSTYEIENILLQFTPAERDVIIPKDISNQKLMEVMRIIKRRRFFYQDMFNQESIINFRNGLLDIVKCELMPHTMDIITTIQLPYSYDPKAECPVFMRFLNESLEGNLEKIGILQEFFGYCLTKSTKYEKGMFIVGEANTGKSTVLDALEAIMGEENCSSIRLDMLCDSRFTGNLMDKYVNIDNEIPQNIDNYEEALKKIISGQKVTVNTKFIPTYDAKPFCKLIFAANDLPRINDSSNAIFRRLLLLDFNNVVPDDKIDVHLKEKVKSECAGIFNWALEGLKRLEKNRGFTKSYDMSVKINDLKMLNNSIYYFIEENYVVTESEKDYVLVDTIYEKYKNFCFQVGAKGVFKKPVFGKEINKVYVKKVYQGRVSFGGHQKRVWFGLREKTEHDKMGVGESDEQIIENDDLITWED